MIEEPDDVAWNRGKDDRENARRNDRIKSSFLSIILSWKNE